MTLLWLDDVRPAPDGWTWCRSVNEAIEVLRAGDVEYASLDHDLGDYTLHGGDGALLTDWMAGHNIWPDVIRIHSYNGVGANVMQATIDTYSPYMPWGPPRERGETPDGGWPPIPAL